MSRRSAKIPGTRARRALLVLPAIADDQPDARKNAIALRNAASAAGVCPACSARAEVVPDSELLGLWHAYFMHKANCPALSDEVAA